MPPSFRNSLCVLLIAQPALLQADGELETLITEIQRQESHYRELECVATGHFERSQEEGLNDEFGLRDILVTDSRCELSLRNDRWIYHASGQEQFVFEDTRFVYSGLWNEDAFCMLHENVWVNPLNGEETKRRVSGLLWERTLNLIAMDFGGTRFLRPHTVITAPSPLCMPLSVWLGGREAMASAGFEDIAALGDVTVQDLGETSWQGLVCRHLRVGTERWERSEGIQNIEVEIWLAKERNLLPVHVLLSMHDGEQQVHLGQRTITEWHEISADVFFPKAVHEENYDKELAELERRDVISDQTNWVVESVSTNCDRPDEDFESFSFPEGVEVFKQ